MPEVPSNPIVVGPAAVWLLGVIGAIILWIGRWMIVEIREHRVKTEAALAGKVGHVEFKDHRREMGERLDKQDSALATTMGMSSRALGILEGMKREHEEEKRHSSPPPWPPKIPPIKR